jgi:hypothetical protein
MPVRRSGTVASVTDGWHLESSHAPVTGEHAVELINARADEGQFETWFEHDNGRLLAVVTNGARAMVMVLDEPGDAGEHAIDPTATGEQSEYVLANRQHDTYDNRDTVPLQQALMIVKHVIEHGRAPAGIGWQIDR